MSVRATSGRLPVRRMRHVVLVAPVAAVALVLGACGSGSAPHRASHAKASLPHPGGTQPVRRPPPARVRVRTVGRLPAPVQLPAVAARGRDVLLAGGLDATDASVADVVRVRGSHAAVVARLPQALHDAAAATVGRATYLFGGGDAGAGHDAILRLNPVVRPAGTLPDGASDVEAATVGDTAYVVGGYTGTTPLRSIVAFRPGQRARVVAELPVPLRYAAVAAVGDAVLIAGGTSGVTAEREILRFDPASGRVRRIGALPAPTTHAAGAALGGRFYVIGGRGRGLTSQRAAILAVDPASGRVRRAGHLPTALSDTGAATVAGHVVIAGGRDRAGGVHDELRTMRARP